MGTLHNTAAGVLLCTGILVAGPSLSFGIEPARTTANPAMKNAIFVTINPNVEMDCRMIRLGDVATITCSDANLRDRLKQLDLEDALAIGETVTIKAPQIKFRLQIAGIDGDRIVIKGTSVQVTTRTVKSRHETEQIRATDEAIYSSYNESPVKVLTAQAAKSRRPIDLNATVPEEGSLEREVIQAAQACVISRLPWPADSIDIRLAQPVPADVRQAGLARGYELTADLRSSGAAVGRVQVRVIAEAPQRPTYEVPVVLEVRHFDKVVVTARSLERGHVISAADLYIDRQDVTDLAEYCSDIGDLVGQSMKRSLRALQPLRMNDLETASRTDTVILVKRREQVKMVARAGAVTVEAMGEALQDGRLGETIRLRNIESNANVQGRITRSGEVEVAF